MEKKKGSKFNSKPKVQKDISIPNIPSQPLASSDSLLTREGNEPDNFLVFKPLRKVYGWVARNISPLLTKITVKHEKAPHTETKSEEYTTILPQIVADDAIVQTFIILATIFGLIAAGLGFTKQYIFLSFAIFLTASCLIAALFRKLKMRFRRSLFTMTIILAALGTYFLYHQILKDQTLSAPSMSSGTSPSNTQKIFRLIDRGAFQFNGFPGPLLYVYGTSPNLYIAPIGLALNLEAVNNRSTPTKVYSYLCDVYTNSGKWVRIYNLPMNPPKDIYFANLREITKCVLMKFSPNVFDVSAIDKTLQPGESLEGWMLFEWPPELREHAVITKIRIRMTNSQGEIEEAIFDRSLDGNVPGISQLQELGSLGRVGNKEMDFSAYIIRPLMDNK